MPPKIKNRDSQATVAIRETELITNSVRKEIFTDVSRDKTRNKIKAYTRIEESIEVISTKKRLGVVFQQQSGERNKETLKKMKSNFEIVGVPDP
ncbi:hypothetical protein AVEN_174725-1 [Araneus ventricosus]|uniref:Uncharacterized protein n=1 Tax=Araneus ventricosus TaxID=182803 RepID=A0A4Y2BML5_ARAVE|nr:hypothetical protein AVEN_174725-1 [Araneus ventricosus]